MKIGVVYKFKPHKKLNGTLFYCFEYCEFLKQFADATFYIVNISPTDLIFVKKVLAEKYSAAVHNIVPVSATHLYYLKLDKTVVLDIQTFYDCKEFFTNEVHCSSNINHPGYSYKDNRTVTFYGAYEYQKFSVFNHLKIYFDIFNPVGSNSGVFVSCPNPDFLKSYLPNIRARYTAPIILKSGNAGSGNILSSIDTVHYLHVLIDSNNRIIPEAHYFEKNLVIEHLTDIVDSVNLRDADIRNNGIGNYTLSENDEIIKACLKS